MQVKAGADESLLNRIYIYIYIYTYDKKNENKNSLFA